MQPLPEGLSRWSVKETDFKTDQLIRFFRWNGRIPLDEHTALNGVLIETHTGGRDKPTFYTPVKYFATHRLNNEQWKKWRHSLNDYILLLRLSKNRLHAREILNINNATIRASILRRFGLENFIREAGAKVLDVEKGRRLLRVPASTPIMAVEVKDSTTGKTYVLSVPPEMKTCKEAVAWTFGMTPDRYKPLKET